MDYGYTQLEGAIGLMPAKLGPDDKTPAYILKRDNFWKVAIASFVLIVGLAGLYFGTNHVSTNHCKEASYHLLLTSICRIFGKPLMS